MKYRAEGEEEGLKIRAAAAEEKSRLLSEAYKVGEQHRGEGEAEAARIYAEALGEAPELYRFLRTLEANRKFVTRGHHDGPAGGLRAVRAAPRQRSLRPGPVGRGHSAEGGDADALS